MQILCNLLHNNCVTTWCLCLTEIRLLFFWQFRRNRPLLCVCRSLEPLLVFFPTLHCFPPGSISVQRWVLCSRKNGTLFSAWSTFTEILETEPSGPWLRDRLVLSGSSAPRTWHSRIMRIERENVMCRKCVRVLVSSNWANKSVCVHTHNVECTCWLYWVMRPQ